MIVFVDGVAPGYDPSHLAAKLRDMDGRIMSSARTAQGTVRAGPARPGHNDRHAHVL
ncbi:hypothetical protein [Streptomyces rectiverticillatus]|uniref:hypothetical protein n=1 Tax=Streptomyces rectiverticillatus TaxID=173860 RepID=UPI0015C3BA5F|nr:hypothetical protein [Streptomyces rectiverticillatus]